MSNFSSCVGISIINDAVVENDETFLLKSVNTSLVTAVPPTVMFIIMNDDCELIFLLEITEAIIFLICTAAFVSFTDMNYSVIEAGTVEVGVELRGNLSFSVDITVEVNFATAMRKSNLSHFLHKRNNVTLFMSITTAELDYLDVPFNLTFMEASIQSASVSIVDDDLVERPEVIQLLLTTLTPGVIPTDPNSALIEITDNDGIRFFPKRIHKIHYFLFYRCCIPILDDVL